jgi:hypothetical protein
VKFVSLAVCGSAAMHVISCRDFSRRDVNVWCPIATGFRARHPSPVQLRRLTPSTARGDSVTPISITSELTTSMASTASCHAARDGHGLVTNER